MTQTFQTLLAGLLLVISAPGATAQAPADKLDQGLSHADQFMPVFVRMEDQLFSQGGDYEQFCADQPATTKRLELRVQVTRTLREKADRSYAEVQVELDRLIADGQVRGLQRYWIVNGFACEATAEGCHVLAAMDPVGFVYCQRYMAQHVTQGSGTFEPDPELTTLYRGLIADREADMDEPFDPDGLEVPWNLKRVGADRAWTEQGVTGRGVVVAVLDDGLMAIPALTAALWTNPNETLNGQDDDGNGYIDDLFGYNFANQNPYCVSPVGHRHGTMCAGIIVGRPDGEEEKIVTGVAPRARVMPLVGSGQLRGYEYALENGADILSMSYTLEPRTMGQYRGVFRTAHEHLAAAGIVSVGGAGNYATSRPTGFQIGSPKDIPCVIAAAGVLENGQAPASSSRGPVSWQGIRYYDNGDANDPSLGKPDVTGCNGGYPVWTRAEVWVGPRRNRLRQIVHEDSAGYILAIGPSGNSFSGPHAAGVAALMLEANPQLPVWELKRLMEATCTDLGEPGRDTTYGAGMLQADKAAEAARAFGQ